MVNVEVQVRSQAEYGERSLYYWAKSYTEQNLEGEEYRTLMHVVSVSLLNFRLFPDAVPFRSTFQLLEKDRPDICLTQDCVMHYLEIPKLLEEEDSELAEWLFALKHLDETEGPMIVLLKKNHSIQELAARYRRFEKDSDARIAYEDRMKFIRDQASFLGQAKREGFDEGREEGGRARALEIAKSLIESGLPLPEVAKITKLPPEDLGSM